MRALPLLLCLGPSLVPTVADAAGSEPWYRRPACDEAMRTIMTIDFPASEKEVRALEKSRDLDDKACAIYLRVLLSEMFISVYGSTAKYESYRDKHLLRMAKFAKAHAKFGPRFGDLEMEARMRRVRILFERNQQTSALSEARRANKLLTARSDSSSPTVSFVQGVMYSALGQSSALARTLLGMAGLSGNPQSGFEALKRTYEGSSVYRAEAYYLARHFSWELQNKPNPFEDALTIGKNLVNTFPTNPQFAFDYGETLLESDKCSEALEMLGPSLERIRADGSVWAANMRAKLYLLAGRCSIAVGDLSEAKTYRNAMAAQSKNDYTPRVAELDDAIASKGS